MNKFLLTFTYIPNSITRQQAVNSNRKSIEKTLYKLIPDYAF